MKKILNLLGLCARAGRVRSGEEFSLRAVKSGDAKLALMDESASDLSKRTFEKACKTGSVPLIYVQAGALGDAIGKPGRMAAVVLDKGLAERMIRIDRIDTTIPGGH